jgi:hypothetical protein
MEITNIIVLAILPLQSYKVFIYIDQCHTQRFFVAKEIGFLLNQLKKSCNNDHKIVQWKTSYGIGMDGMVPKVISKWQGKLQKGHVNSCHKLWWTLLCLLNGSLMLYNNGSLIFVLTLQCVCVQHILNPNKLNMAIQPPHLLSITNNIDLCWMYQIGERENFRRFVLNYTLTFLYIISLGIHIQI